jgi:thiol-disulfide isomerase/thioredoxin
MKSFRIPIAILVITMIALIACSSAVEESKTDEATTAPQKMDELQKLPSFTMLGANGNKVNLASFVGKKVFVNLWATWCPPCRHEIPSIEKVYKEADKDKAVFVLLSLDEYFDVAKEFAATNKLQVPVFYPVEKLPGLFNVDAIPATYLFNEKGELIKEIKSMDDYYTKEYIELFK